MIPNYGSAGTYTIGTADAGSVAIPYPATVNRDDLLIMSVMNNTDNSISTPSGWTLISTQSITSQARVSWFYMRAGGEEIGSVTVQSSVESGTMSGQIFRYTDVLSSGTPIEASSSSSIGNASTYTVPTCTTLGTDRLQIALVVVLNAAGTLQAPSGWTEDVDNNNSPPSRTFGAMSIDRAAALGYSSTTGNISTTAYSTAMTLAILPETTSYVTVNQATCDIAVSMDAEVDNIMKIEQATCDIAVTLDAVMENLATVNQATCDIAVTLDVVMASLAAVNQATCDIQFSMDSEILNLMIIEQATCDITVTGTASMLNLMKVNQATCDIVFRCLAEMTANKEDWTQIEEFESLITIEINV